MPGAFPRATDALERCLACALPDLRQSRSEAYRAGARAHSTLVDLACLPFAGVPLRTVPAQILLNPAEALRGHGRTFSRGLTDRIPGILKQSEERSQSSVFKVFLASTSGLCSCPANQIGQSRALLCRITPRSSLTMA